MQNKIIDEQKAGFREVLERSKSIVVSTGAGVSAESGVPTFRGEGGLWKKYDAASLATPEAFLAKPELVWEFYNHRRKLVDTIRPNPGHFAIAKLEQQCQKTGKDFTLVTQNVDGLHSQAGSKNILEVHGSLHKIKCSKCSFHADFDDIAITENFKILGESLDSDAAEITINDLPKCPKCNAMLRPDIVWFGESLDPFVLEEVDIALSTADLLISVGTSLQIYPAAAFPMMAKFNGAKIACVNFEETGQEDQFDFVFIGKSGEILPNILDF